VYFFIYFVKYWFVFLYRKDTNPVLKYMVFVKTLQNNYKTKQIYFIFMHTAKSLKDKKKIITSYFPITKKIILSFLCIKQKHLKKVLACTLALITSLLEP